MLKTIILKIGKKDTQDYNTIIHHVSLSRFFKKKLSYSSFKHQK